jgi:hypothetical protein
MDASTLRLYASDPASFRAALVIPSAHGPARFGDVMAPFQAVDFAALDSAFIALKDGRRPEVGRFWLERTKGASKDSDLAVCLLWLLAFSPRSLTCQVGAADQDQADELRLACKAIVRLNPWIGGILEVQALAVVNHRTDSRCEIIPADVAGSHGSRPDLLILNELSHVQKKEFAENLFDNAAKIPHGVAVIATNAGFRPSWQWSWRQQALTSPRWYFSTYRDPAPWLDPAELSEAEKRNSPSRFARLWRGKWVSGGGDALDENDILAAVKADLGPMDGTEQGYVFYAGLDLGVKQDHAAFVVVGKHIGFVERGPEPEPVTLPPILAACADLGLMDSPSLPEPVYKFHPGSGRLRLAYCQSWAPRPGGQIDLTAVETSILETSKRIRLAAVCYDPFQAALMAQRLRRQYVRMEEITFTGANLDGMASAVLETFKAREIDLYDEPDLIADLGKLRIVEKSYGYRLDAPRDESGHADRATGLALAVLGSRRFRYSPPPRIEGELICYPSAAG